MTYKNRYLLALIFCTHVALAQSTEKDSIPIPININEIPYVETNWEKGPPLKEVRVTRVFSNTSRNGEPITQGQQATRMIHAGRVRLFVFEKGYGTSTVARLNGLDLPLSAMVRTDPLCRAPNGDYALCRRGAAAEAYIRVWDLGVNKGELTYFSTSVYPPYIEHSTRLIIN